VHSKRKQAISAGNDFEAEFRCCWNLTQSEFRAIG